MARITPKTNWDGASVPIAADFNRIENNAQQAFDEIDAETARVDATKMPKAVNGDNGGVGSIITVTTIVVDIGGGMYRHTYTLPRSGIWLAPHISLPDIGGATRIFYSNSVIFVTITPYPQQAVFWQIG